MPKLQIICTQSKTISIGTPFALIFGVHLFKVSSSKNIGNFLLNKMSRIVKFKAIIKTNFTHFKKYCISLNTDLYLCFLLRSFNNQISFNLYKCNLNEKTKKEKKTVGTYLFVYIPRVTVIDKTPSVWTCNILSFITRYVYRN